MKQVMVNVIVNLFIEEGNMKLNVESPFHFGHRDFAQEKDTTEKVWHSIDLDDLKTDRTIYDQFNAARFVIKPCKDDGKSLEEGCTSHRIDAEALRKSIQSIKVMDSKSADVQSQNEYLNSSYNWKNLQTD